MWLQALILVRGTGSVTVSTADTLDNLLGPTQEWFEPAPSVARIADGSFLGLEVPGCRSLCVYCSVDMLTWNS